MQMNDWALDDIKKQMRHMSLVELKELYKQKNTEFTQACVKYTHLSGNEKMKQEEICELLDKEVLTIAVRIADRITSEN